MMDKPEWFNWYQELGFFLASQPTVGLGENALRVVISAPNADFVPWAIASGALTVDKSPERVVVPGNRAVTWCNGRMKDVNVISGTERMRLRWEGGGIAYGHEWPFAYTPELTPEGRSVRPLNDDDKIYLRQAWGAHWYVKYAKKCVLPATILGSRSEMMGQLGELLSFCRHWFTDEARALLFEDSMQVTNPNRFGMFPFMVLNQSVAAPRPWLREMESRLVISSTFASHRGLSRFFQQGVPRVILTDRRMSGANDAHAFIRDLNDADLVAQDFNFPPAPNGVYVKAFTERVLEDPGTDELGEDIEEYML